MTTRNGHIASLVIAVFFATLLVASWFPAKPDGEQSRRLFAFQDITQVYKEEKKDVAKKTDREMPRAADHEVAHTTDASPRMAMPSQKQEKSVEPDSRVERKTENNKVTGWDMFWEIKATDVLLVIFMGLVWWNSWNIWKALRAIAQNQMETSDEVIGLTRAASAMEALAKTVAAATAPEPVIAKPGRKKSKTIILDDDV